MHSLRAGTRSCRPTRSVELPNAYFALIPYTLPTVCNWQRHSSRPITNPWRWNLCASMFAWHAPLNEKALW